MLSRTSIVAFLIIVALSVIASADDSWPRFRGSDATGVTADDPRLPDTWSETENVRWSTDVQGWGWSCPVVAEGKVFLTSVWSEEAYEIPQGGLYLGQGRSEPPESVHHWVIYCLDFDSGEILWERQVHEGAPEFTRHPKSTYASETPVTDGERIYALFGDLGLYCCDMEGELLWSHEVEHQPSIMSYGAAASPILCGDLIVMVYDNQVQSYIEAFDKTSGESKWRTDRDDRSTWATPFLWENELRSEIIVPGFEATRSYGLDGEVLWEMKAPMSNLVIPSPFAAHGFLYLTSGYVGDRDRPVYVIKPGASGQIDFAEDDSIIEWTLPQAGPYNTTPIVYGDLYYTLHDRGFLTCHDAKTGEELYDRTRFPESASFTASPWAYNGKLFCLSEQGDTFVVKVGPEFEVERINRLVELCIATPAAVQGRLLIRTASKLYCIEDEGE
jgi:outer membrane protein assembly factor BamB